MRRHTAALALLLALMLPGMALAELGAIKSPCVADTGPTEPPAYTWSSTIRTGQTKGGESFWYLTEDLQTAGWTASMSGGGTGTGCAEQDASCWTKARAEAGNRAYIVLEEPASGREICIRVGGIDQYFVITYSAGGNFVFASDEDSTPAATDRQNLVGIPDATVDIFPTASPWDCYYSVASDGERPFWMSCDDGGTSSATMLYDPLWRYATGDTDPAVLYVFSNLTSLSTYGSGSTMRMAGYLDHGGGSEAWSAMVATAPAGEAGSQHFWVDDTAVSPETGYDELYHLQYGRDDSETGLDGFKGVSCCFKGVGLLRTPGDTYTVQTTRDYIMLGYLALPWDGTASGSTHSAQDIAFGPWP